MSSREEYLYNQLFENAEYFEAKGVIHIGPTTGKSGHWIAHPLCGRRLRGWIGFNELKYAKSSFVCDTCFLLYAITKLGSKVRSVTSCSETVGDKK